MYVPVSTYRLQLHGNFPFAAATERGDDMVLAMLSRGCQAIRELGTLDLIEH